MLQTDVSFGCRILAYQDDGQKRNLGEVCNTRFHFFSNGLSKRPPIDDVNHNGRKITRVSVSDKRLTDLVTQRMLLLFRTTSPSEEKEGSLPNQAPLPLGVPAAAPVPGGKTLDPPPTVTKVYGISCGISAEAFFGLLEKYGVGLVVDTRLSRTYQGARFADGGDLPYLCRAHRLDYTAVEELAPTRALRDELATTFTDVKKAGDRDPEAWSRFLRKYASLLIERKFLRVDGPTHHLLFEQKHRAVAFLCACGQPDDCHRSVLLGMLGRFVRGLETGQLQPSVLHRDGIEDPAFKGPRRYRVEHLPAAGLRANATTAAFRDLAQRRQAHPRGETP